MFLFLQTFERFFDLVFGRGNVGWDSAQGLASLASGVAERFKGLERLSFLGEVNIVIGTDNVDDLVFQFKNDFLGNFASDAGNLCQIRRITGGDGLFEESGGANDKTDKALLGPTPETLMRSLKKLQFGIWRESVKSSVFANTTVGPKTGGRLFLFKFAGLPEQNSVADTASALHSSTLFL